MTTDRFVARAIVGWIGLAVLMTLGMAWMATAVEGAHLGLTAALWLGALRSPMAVVVLTPMLCCVGAALAAARMETRNERAALESAGLGPWRSGRAALVVGLSVGGLQWWVASYGVPAAEMRARGIEARPESAWIWLDGSAVRPMDGRRVVLENGRIVDVGTASDLDPFAIRRARMVQTPETARADVLAASDLVPARVEHRVRQHRVLACALLCFVGWLPLGRRAVSQVSRALGIGLVFQCADLVLRVLASQGRVPVWVGAGGAMWGVLALLTIIGWRRSDGALGYLTARIQ